MKRFITRACAKIGSFFWSWGFLKFVLAMIALAILLYVEEDWRGAHNWAVTKAKWETKGETFDYSKFIPPPVPDEQNLAAIPLFKLENAQVTYGKPYLDTVALKRAMRSDLLGLDVIPLGSWQKGELPDMADIRKKVAGNYAIACKGTPPPADTLAQFNAIYPFLADFLAAATTRPEFRINSDYGVSPPLSRPLGPVTGPIKLSQILTQHAILALDQHRPDLALPDCRITYVLLSGVKGDPSLVGGLVAIALNAVRGAAIYDGLAEHEWSDAQLVELDQTLKPINFLADFQFAMRCEVAQSVVNLDFYESASRSELSKTSGEDSDPSRWVLIRFFLPSGWWDGNKSRDANGVLETLACVDPKAQLVFPKKADDFEHQLEEERSSWSALAPWNFLADVAIGPITSALKKFAQGQAWVDEMRIACALERYRLANGVYPAALDALAPAYIDEVPHDIMDGQAYHYQLRPDGTYLLYSVGWNQTDEGGTVAYKTGYDPSSKQIDYDQGDWVWPTPNYSR
jgi:hypothetical protein